MTDILVEGGTNIEMEEPGMDRREPGHDQFEQLLEKYEYDRPRRGQVVQGKVIQVYDDMILVDIGAKRDAIVPKTDLSRLDESILENISRGDPVSVYVFHTGVGDGELLVSLEKGLANQDWDRATRFLSDDPTIELKAVGFNSGGLLVEFGLLEGFIPNSHIIAIPRGASRQQKDDTKSELVGTSLPVKVLEVDQARSRLLFSERDAHQERRQRRLRQLEKGHIVSGEVVNIVDFGAFVDLDGVDGLVHISELDWKHIKHPSDVLAIGDQIEVQVVDVDVDRERVSLSRKATLPSPWDHVKDHFKVGDLVEGTVTNVRDFGAFVTLPEEVVGLIHISEIGFSGSGNPGELVKLGDPVLARIVEFDPQKQRLSLSMQRVTYEEQMAWMLAAIGASEQPESLSPMQAALLRTAEKDATDQQASQSQAGEELSTGNDSTPDPGG